MYINKYLKYKNKYLKLKNQLGGAPHFCQPEELMSNPNYEVKCVNVTCVNGSCGHPSFRDGLADLSDEVRDQNIRIFNLILEKNDIRYLDIILGATTNVRSDFDDLGNSLQLCISPIDNFDNFETLQNKIKTTADFKGQLFTFKSEFPLNHITPNCKAVLDLLLQINASIKVRITNRMCGTCHRSLYFLVKHGIEYKVNPEQGLNPVLDTPEIINCFKDLDIYTKLSKERYGVINEDDTFRIVYPPT